MHNNSSLMSPLQTLMLSLIKTASSSSRRNPAKAVVGGKLSPDTDPSPLQTSPLSAAADDALLLAVADRIIEYCSNLGPGPIGSADDDDSGGYLPLAMAVRNFPTVDERTGRIVPGAVQIKADLAISALRRCLIEVTGEVCIGVGAGAQGDVGVGGETGRSRLLQLWEKEVQASTGRCLENIPEQQRRVGKNCDGEERGRGTFSSSVPPLPPPRWRTMVAAEAGLRVTMSLGEFISLDSPRYLACTELVGTCVEVGLKLLAGRDNNDDGNGEALNPPPSASSSSADYHIPTPEMATTKTTTARAGIYRDVHDAGAASDLLDRLEDIFSALKRTITAVFVYPHLRRAKELLAWLAIYCRHKKVEASVMARREEGETGQRVQRSLSDWITSGDDGGEEADSQGG